MSRHGCLLFAISVFAVSVFAGCAQGRHTLIASDAHISGGKYVGLINSYSRIRQDFDKGRIMRARARVLAMQKGDKDYARARTFLMRTIEPTRRRIFVYYLHTAQRLEANKQWSKAMWAYDQASSVTIKPSKMEAKRDEMEIRMRQLRLDKLIVHRRKLDRLLMDDAHAYDAPRGLDPNDDTYGRMRDQYNDLLDERESLAIREARRQLRKGLPEIAYMEIESYLRMQPGSIAGKILRHEILAAMPKGLVIPPYPGKEMPVRKSVANRQVEPDKVVSEKQIQEALKQGDLIRARSLAHLFRRNGGSGADSLLAKINKKLAAKAASLFAKGSNEFRHERLASAVAYWHKAVDLNPDQPEYVESLRRARQLQERLELLRGQVDSKKNGSRQGGKNMPGEE